TSAGCCRCPRCSISASADGRVGERHCRREFPTPSARCDHHCTVTDVADSTSAVRVTEALVRAHQAALWRYLRVLGCRAVEAEDRAQETFLARRAARLPGGSAGAVRAWLRATARNQFFARCRQQRREPRLDADLDAAVAAYERDDDGEGYRQALRSCIEALSP